VWVFFTAGPDLCHLSGLRATGPDSEGNPSNVGPIFHLLRWWVRRGPNLTSPRIVRDQVNDDG